MHQQTKNKEEVNKEIYKLLELNINQIANSDIKIILQNFNANVGNEDI
jgi:hypothetical protein